MSSMEIILGEPSRLERLAVDIHDHYVSSCAEHPETIKKAMEAKTYFGRQET